MADENGGAEKPVVAVLMPGDMGHAIGAVLRAHGVTVVTCAAGRSADTRTRVARAGLIDLPDLAAVARAAEIVLSIVPPGTATALAEDFAAALRAAGARPVFVDCNAIAPDTARRIAAVVEAAGARFVDGGIIGAPPKDGRGSPALYLSGAEADQAAVLGRYGLDIRVLGTEIGQASALKMCYAALTKGLIGIATGAFATAHRLGVAAELERLGQDTLAPLLHWLDRPMPQMPPKAYRWVAEMEAIAETFASAGLTPRIFEGEAALFQTVADSPLGEETTERRLRGTTREEVSEVLAAALAGLAAPDQGAADFARTSDATGPSGA